MEPTEEEQDFTRWLDGELTAEEAGKLLREHPDWPARAEAATELGDQLRASLSESEDIPYADFFNTQVRRRIEGDVFSDPSGAAAAASPAAETEESVGFPIFSRLRWLAGAGFALMAGLMTVYLVSNNSSDQTKIVKLYTPEAGVSATTQYDDDAGATVIHLTGLADVPATTVFRPASYSPAAGFVVADPPREPSLFYQFQSRSLGRPVSVFSHGESGFMPAAVRVDF